MTPRDFDIDWEIPEFDFRPSLARCNDMLTIKERQGITGAAVSAAEGDQTQADRWREWAGYAGLNK